MAGFTRWATGLFGLVWVGTQADRPRVIMPAHNHAIVFFDRIAFAIAATLGIVNRGRSTAC
ncbi:hypothetical protein GCM10023307_18380 [Lysobacter hankyongensis]|uniref:Uncharacterized protein n=1 Tax=Lysobacter hankyongensis TaxID=1176535 RepID=A0ABP9BE20_9GAMM